MRIFWPAQFGTWLAELRKAATADDPIAKQRLVFVAEALKVLRELDEPPTADTETGDLKRVRQSRKYVVWRISHPYHKDVAVRVICWFPPDSKTAVITLFAFDKARIGDVWYNSVGPRADAIIEQWKREVGYDREG